MTITYAIGDIHGHLDKLQFAHELIARDRAHYGASDTPVVHLGDLIDRGPDSRGVIELLMQGQAAGEPWTVIKGNHDRMLLGFLADPHATDPGLSRPLPYTWKNIGGATTLASYGVDAHEDRPIDDIHADALAAVPKAHQDWIAALPLYQQRGDALFVHAGLRPGIALEDQSEEDLLWIRQPFHNDLRDHGALVVHGHTPVDEATHYGNRLNLDTGAGYGKAVTAAVIEGRKAWHLTPTGRVPLRPAS